MIHLAPAVFIKFNEVFGWCCAYYLSIGLSDCRVYHKGCLEFILKDSEQDQFFFEGFIFTSTSPECKYRILAKISKGS